jgi:hypothetical protein
MNGRAGEAVPDGFQRLGPMGLPPGTPEGAPVAMPRGAVNVGTFIDARGPWREAARVHLLESGILRTRNIP